MSIRVVPYISKQISGSGLLIVGTFLINLGVPVCQQNDTRDLLWMLVTEKVGTRCHKTDIVVYVYIFYFWLIHHYWSIRLLPNPTFAVIKSCLRFNDRAIWLINIMPQTLNRLHIRAATNSLTLVPLYMWLCIEKPYILLFKLSPLCIHDSKISGSQIVFWM